MLPPHNRLRHARLIRSVRQEGQRVKHPLFILYFRPNSEGASRFCFSASRRVGGAVQRNRAKRLMREAVRLRLNQLSNSFDCVWVARRSLLAAPFADIAHGVDQLLGRAGLLAQEATA